MRVVDEIKEVLDSDTLLYLEITEGKDVVRYEEENTDVVRRRKCSKPVTRAELGEVFELLSDGMSKEDSGIFGVDFQRIYTIFNNKKIYIVTTVLADNQIALFVRFI